MGAAPTLAQTAIQTPAPTTAKRADKAKADIREVSDKLAAVTVPMNIEPSFRFTA